MSSEQPGDAPETSFLQARFQAAFQKSNLNSLKRYENRASNRARLTPPGLVPPCWAVATAFRYDVEREGSGERYVVPAGFEFDGASVPPLFRWFVPQTHSSYMGAAALHDFLYEALHEEVPRARADAVFREAMLVSGLHWFWAGLMWRAVRAGGWAVWYLRKPGSWPHQALSLPWALRSLAVLFGTAGLFLAGVLAVDLWNLGRYRAMAAEIAARDAGRYPMGGQS